MNKPSEKQIALVLQISAALNSQTLSQLALGRSRPMQRHADTVGKTAKAIKSIIAKGSFDTLLNAEIAIQKAELEKFSTDAAMMASIRKTQKDMAEAIKDYRQLVDNPDAYGARGYRDQDRVGKYPKDTMRKTLRSQAARIANFAKNPLLSPEEKELHRLRVSMLKRCEQLYESIQERMLKFDGAE